MTEVKKDAIVVDESGNAVAKREETAVSETKQGVATVEQSIISQLSLAGTIAFTKKQQDILFAPIPEEEVEIRPDGLIYLPWVGYVRRLRDAFGGQWSIIPIEKKPQMNPDNDGLMWGFYLVLSGKPYGYAIGEQKYIESNKTMSWLDAAEGCKSNALMRLCKGIGIGLEMWSPSYMKVWKEKWGERYWDSYKNKKLWRKIDKSREVVKATVEKKMAEESVEKKKKTKETPVEVRTEQVIPPQEMPTDKTPKEDQVAKVLSIMGTLVDRFKVDPGFAILFFKRLLKDEFAIGLGEFKVPESLEERHCSFVIDFFRDKKNPDVYSQVAVKQAQEFDPGVEEQGRLV